MLKCHVNWHFKHFMHFFANFNLHFYKSRILKMMIFLSEEVHINEKKSQNAWNKTENLTKSYRTMHFDNVRIVKNISVAVLSDMFFLNLPI